MFEKVIKVNALNDYQIKAVFSDGSARQYDVKPLLTKFKEFQPLREDPQLFFNIKPICCGSAVAWTDSIDIASEEIWENGQVVQP